MKTPLSRFNRYMLQMTLCHADTDHKIHKSTIAMLSISQMLIRKI